MHLPETYQKEGYELAPDRDMTGEGDLLYDSHDGVMYFVEQVGMWEVLLIDEHDGAEMWVSIDSLKELIGSVYHPVNRWEN